MPLGQQTGRHNVNNIRRRLDAQFLRPRLDEDIYQVSARHRRRPLTPALPQEAAEAATPPDDHAIVERIHDAVMEQRLPPGTKLSEAALCEAFGVRRARIRRSFLILASRNIVELRANRGAFVSRPTPAEARDVFEARRAT
ncbi:MAG: GntR family transcriptional regulator, partial [Rhodobacteraceae bacterium]|nr:GntR family transcriptional regulator [Paracoccaceae bacterium]